MQLQFERVKRGFIVIEQVHRSRIQPYELTNYFITSVASSVDVIIDAL